MTRVAVMVVLIAAGGLSRRAASAEFYVDPSKGSAKNDGSAENPWRSIQEVIDQGLVESQQWEKLPYRAGARLVPRNQGAPVRAGDTIYLRSGCHGELLIDRFYNRGFITLAAERGHTPKFSRICLRSSARWIIRGLQVSPEFAPTYRRQTMIALESHGFRGPVHDILVEDCDVQSVQDSSHWSAQQWDTRSCNGIEVDGTRMTVRNCRFKNVNFGISVSATESLIERNTVENFAGDGMRGLGDHTTFQYNTVKNCYDVNQNHDDGFQSWSRGADGRVGGGEVRGIVLRGNMILNYDNPQQPHRGTLQGIGCFDGLFVDWVVENNVIITDHYHGLTLSGAQNCRIVNNTVVDINQQSPGPAWIRVGKHKNGTPSSGCVVRNNLATRLIVDEGENMVIDHNLAVEDPDQLFVNFGGRDLHLKPGVAAIDAGSRELAPAQDAEGTTRPQGKSVDLGAYEFRE